MTQRLKEACLLPFTSLSFRLLPGYSGIVIYPMGSGVVAVWTTHKELSSLYVPDGMDSGRWLFDLAFPVWNEGSYLHKSSGDPV